MAIAPTKNTGGGGFVFENRVVAFFLAAMLVDAAVEPRLGSLVNVAAQQGHVGWLLDDLVLRFSTAHQDESSLALSIKSNPQFSGRRAPPEFVETAWRQLLGEGRALGQRDLLGICTAPMSARITAAVNTLLAATATSETDLPSRMNQPGAVSQEARNILATLACPSVLAKGRAASDVDVSRLLSRLRVLEFDFESPQSTRTAAALLYCRTALRRREASEAESLWEFLLALGDEIRPSGGDLSREQLIDRVSARYELAEYPNYASDETRLRAISRDLEQRVVDRIGEVRLERSLLVDQVSGALDVNTSVALVGSSGAGKTALARLLAERLGPSAPVVWMDAVQFATPTIPELSTSLGLAHDLDEILLARRDDIAYLIVDGLDRGGTGPVELFALLGQRLLGASRPAWRILIPCRAEEWPRMQGLLARSGFPVGQVERVDLSEPTVTELEPVWAAYPQLRRLTYEPKLQSLLLKPKVLDLFARRIASPEVSGWVGESDLIQWFWREVVESSDGGLARSASLQQLAGGQADRLETETALARLGTLSLDDLRQRGLIEVADERVRVAHDLFGDWSRQRILVGEGAAVLDYAAPRLSSPPWHRAIRLFALSLLEHSRIEEWRRLLVEAESRQLSVLEDLLLEAAVFAIDPRSVLAAVWPELERDDGRLLRRFLGRFKFIATIANPSILAWAAQEDPSTSEAEAASLFRIPYPLYWPPVLSVLAEREDAVVRFAPRAAAEVTEIWLRLGPTDWPARHEAARLALAIAEDTYRKRRDGVWYQDDTDEVTYRAGLAGARELPERAADLALRLVRRRDIADVKKDVSTPFEGRAELPPPWPLGPAEHFDDAVDKTVLNGDGLAPLIAADPASAREVMLAAVIEHPRSNYHHGIHDPFEQIGLRHILGWHPPLWINGPFIQLLNASPEEGIGAVLDLVNFATDRWAELAHADDVSVSLSLASGDRRYLGDESVYRWSLGESGGNALPVALMALERFLYQRLEAGEEVEGLLDRLLQESRSTSVLGVLVSTACHTPVLLEGALQPLLACPELIVWDSRQKNLPNSMETLFSIGLVNKAPVIRQIAHEWLSMPHRRVALEGLAVQLMLLGGMADFFSEARTQWQKSPHPLVEEAMPRLVRLFDSTRWQPEIDEQGRQVIAFQPSAEEMQAAADANAELAASLDYMNLPIECRQILDGGKELAAGDVEAFWRRVVAQESAARPDGFEPGFLNREDGLCGGICVLLVFHREWLRADPEKDRWCKETLLSTLSQPPRKHHMLDQPGDNGDWAWDRFASQAFGVLWSEDPDDTDLRHAVAEYACALRYATVATLFRSASAYRQNIAPDFAELNALGTWWATMRPELRIEGARERALRSRSEAIDAFVRRDSVPHAEWAKVPKEWPQVPEKAKPQSGRRRRPRVRPLADLEQIRAVHDWIPNLTDAASEGERVEWLTFWRQALALELSMLDAADEDWRVDGVPYEWDRWVLERLAQTVLVMREDEGPRSIWAPILKLGVGAHLWVQSFVYAWILNGLASAPASDTFTARWAEMIEFAFECESWQPGSGFGFAYLDDLWIDLMGCDWIYKQSWVAAHQPVLKKMIPLFERWTTDWLVNTDCAERFIGLVRTEAGQVLQGEALQWLSASQQSWADDDLQTELARLLDSVWVNHRALVAADSPEGRAFRRLLSDLASLQNPVALALTERIADA